MSMFMLSSSDSMRVEVNLCRFGCIICLYVYCRWDPVINRGEFGSSYQEGRVGIQLSRGESWDPVIKRGELGSH